MGMRDILRNGRGSRGTAFQGSLESKDPDRLDAAAAVIRGEAKKHRAAQAIEAAVGDADQAERLGQMANLTEGEANRYEKTSWLKRMTG